MNILLMLLLLTWARNVSHISHATTTTSPFLILLSLILRNRFYQLTSCKVVLPVSFGRQMDGGFDVSHILCGSYYSMIFTSPYKTFDTSHWSVCLCHSGMLKGPDKGSFYNERFIRGIPFLCRKMKRIGETCTCDFGCEKHKSFLYLR